MWWKRMLGLSSGWNYNIDEHVLIFLEQQAQIVGTKWCKLVPNSRRWEILILYFQWRIVRWRRMLGLPSGWGKTGGLLTHIGTAQPSPRPEFLILCMFKLCFLFLRRNLLHFDYGKDPKTISFGKTRKHGVCVWGGGSHKLHKFCL